MKKILAALALLAMGFANSANAGLIGDTVTTELLHNGISFGSSSAVVGPGSEGNFFFNQYFDYDDLSFNILSTSNFCGMNCAGELIELKLTSLDLGGLTSVSFTTNLTGVSMVFGTDFITFSWIDQTLPQGIYIDATFNGGAVPEPEMLTLLGLGLVAAFAARKRNAA